MQTGTLAKLEKLRATASPELCDTSQYLRLDHGSICRFHKKLGVTSVDALKEKLAGGDIDKTLGRRMAEHVHLGLMELTRCWSIGLTTCASTLRRFC